MRSAYTGIRSRCAVKLTGPTKKRKDSGRTHTDTRGHSHTIQATRIVLWINDTVGHDLGTMLVLDPTAGGGSIPLESCRLGCATAANDLNPVAALLLYATTFWPNRFGVKLSDEFQELSSRFLVSATSKYTGIFPTIPKNTTVSGYVWARTIPCPHCSGLVPLSPNWKLAPDGTGVKLKPHTASGPRSKGRVCSFQIVRSFQEQSEGTASNGDCVCPYPDCKRVIGGDEIKATARSGNMGEQLYAIVYKKRMTIRNKDRQIARKNGIKEYREPEPQDDNSKFIQARLDEKLAEWDVRDVIPDERIPHGSKTKEAIHFGANYWRDLFSSRQLLCHGTSVEVFRELLDQDIKNGTLTGIRKAAYGYLAIALDTMLNYNSRLTTWHANRTVAGPTFARHDYGFSWSYVEMAPLIAGLGYEWVFDKTAKCIRELLDLNGSETIYTRLDQTKTVEKPEARNYLQLR